MVLKTGTFDGMARDLVDSGDDIIVFGTGVIGSTITPEILREYNLIDKIICCVDNDKSRWNSFVDMCGKKIKISSPDILKRLSNNITILIAVSRYGGVLEQLNNMNETEKMSCFIVPMICINSFREKGGKGVFNSIDEPLIPKKIHYMWLGKKEIPEKLKHCIDSWKYFCPDYEIIRWDESNYDVHKNKFMSQSYDNQKYGFVPDFARLDLLYEHGGIYLDTDVELKRNIDDLLYQEAFCSVEKWQVLNFGGCSGAVKGHKSLEPFIQEWANRSLIRDDGSLDSISSGLIDTSIALRFGYKINGKNQVVNGMNIYSYDYFHPYDYMSGKLDTTDDTFSIHHFDGGWLDEKTRTVNMQTSKIYDILLQSAVNVG